ncbi:hypothetical protein GCM10023191_018220 [Actinoallomurus oryzae]|jgi:hypothetical protein|uniref:DUF1232 domain-containing protein n=1 Tax=Actinoallomurus oryzae TaxID=502180 RepID=A0ABP8PLQ9_9ACTN|nr:YkvA family protein [Actinoallomurus sp. NBC_01490]
MILPGVLALLVGAVLAFAVHGDVGGVGVGTVGVIVMIIGGLILIAGLLRLRRGSRQRIAGRRDRVYRTSKGKIIAMVIAVIYIVSPIDIVPDFLLPVGVIDDATAFGWLLFAIGQEVTRRRGGQAA